VRIERSASLSELPPDAIVSLPDVAHYLGVSVSTVRRSAIPVLHVTPRTPRYRVADVLAWVRRQTQGAA